MPSLSTRRLNSVFKQLMSVHWWMAAVIFVSFVSGKFMSGIEGAPSLREFLFGVHKYFGVLGILMLSWRSYLLVRVWGQKYRRHRPQLTVKWYSKTTLHSLLYLLMLAVPLSGYWLSNSDRNHNISLFGMPMPDIFAVSAESNASASAAHSYTSKAFALFILLHFACQHRVVKANWRRFATWIQRGKLTS